MSHRYTFVLEYAGGTYVSQYNGRTVREALRRWLRNEAERLEAVTRQKLSTGLQRAYENDPSPVLLNGLENAWCWTTNSSGVLALLTIVKTAKS